MADVIAEARRRSNAAGNPYRTQVLGFGRSRRPAAVPRQPRWPTDTLQRLGAFAFIARRTHQLSADRPGGGAEATVGGPGRRRRSPELLQTRYGRGRRTDRANSRRSRVNLVAVDKSSRTGRRRLRVIRRPTSIESPG